MLRRFSAPESVQLSNFDGAIQTFCLPIRFPQGLPDPTSLTHRIDRCDALSFADRFVHRESRQSLVE
jgi:hypothetical protein